MNMIVTILIVVIALLSIISITFITLYALQKGNNNEVEKNQSNTDDDEQKEEKEQEQEKFEMYKRNVEGNKDFPHIIPVDNNNNIQNPVNSTSKTRIFINTRRRSFKALTRLIKQLLERRCDEESIILLVEEKHQHTQDETNKKYPKVKSIYVKNTDDDLVLYSERILYRDPYKESDYLYMDGNFLLAPDCPKDFLSRIKELHYRHNKKKIGLSRVEPNHQTCYLSQDVEHGDFNLCPNGELFEKPSDASCFFTSSKTYTVDGFTTFKPLSIYGLDGDGWS